MKKPPGKGGFFVVKVCLVVPNDETSSMEKLIERYNFRGKNTPAIAFKRSKFCFVHANIGDELFQIAHDQERARHYIK
jgi:hypothetical protein